MFKVLTPILALCIAFGLGITYIKPQFENIKETQTEEQEYVDALVKATELRELIDTKEREKVSFSPVDVERLQIMVPDELNEVSIVLDLDALARTHALSLSNIQVAEGARVADSQVRERATPTTEESAAPLPYVTKDISFQVVGTYDSFRKFVASLEQSLVFFDVVDLKFTDSEGDMVSYAMTLRTYSFNKEL